MISLEPRPEAVEALSSRDYFSVQENRRAVLEFCWKQYGIQEGTSLYNLTIRALGESDIVVLRDNFPEKLVQQTLETVRSVRQEMLNIFNNDEGLLFLLFAEITRRVRVRMMGDLPESQDISKREEAA